MIAGPDGTENRGFDCRLEPGEKIFGWLYLLYLIFGTTFTATLLIYVSYRMGAQISDITMNLIIDLGSLVLTLGFLFRFLKKSYYALLDSFGRTITAAGACCILMMGLSLLRSLLSKAILGDAAALNPNENAIDAMLREHYSAMIVLSVICAPIVEECMFRGVLFGTIREKNRLLAWLVSIALFSVFHLVDDFIFDYRPQLWAYLLDYLPAGIALCLCYEMSGNIWGPILLHAFNNCLGLWAARALL